MNKLTKIISTVALTCAASLAIAAPTNLVIDNNTDFQARAYVNGMSKNPAEAHNTMSLSWFMLKMACMFKTECQAEVKMKTDTGSPVSLGLVSINLDSGAINTSGLNSAEGFKVSYVEPGHAVITQSK